MSYKPKDIRDAVFFQAGDGTHLTELYHPKNGDKNLSFSLAYAKLSPGASSLKHELGQEELYIFTAGKGEIIIDTERTAIESGQSILVPRKTLQYVRNTGDEELCFYCIVSPPWTEEEEQILED